LTLEPAEEEEEEAESEEEEEKQCERFSSLVVFTNVSADASSLKIDVEDFYETFGMNLTILVYRHSRRR
jgi:hypothetical protein